MSSNYYAPDFDPWVSNIRGLGSALAQMPAMRARAAGMQQLAALRQAEVGKAGAETSEANARTTLLGSTTKKTDAQTADIQDETESGNRLSAALKKITANPNDTDAAGDAISEFGHYFKKNPEQAAKGMGDLLSHFMTMRGDTNFAAQGSLQGNAASIANNQANNTRVMQTPMVVPDNSVAIDKTTGKPVATSPQKLSMGQRLFEAGPDNVTLDTKPVVEGAPKPLAAQPDLETVTQTYKDVPAKDAVHHWFGKDEPAVPEHPARKVTYKQPRTATTNAPIDISAAVQPGAAPAATSTPANTDAGPTDVVRVQHPDGTTGYIPSANLTRALQLGYKRLP
jgi:hypothetical protein